MNKHLIELFKENNTVIIPGFGALSLTDRSKGEYMFMSYLKHNDGLLKNQIASSEGISADEAQSKIDAFVADLNSQLKSEQKAELIGLGAFFLDKSGEVDFESNAGDEPAAVIEPVEIIEPIVEELVEEKPEVVEEVIKVEDEKPVIVEEVKEETAESIPEVEEPIVAVEEPIEEEVIPSAIEKQDKEVEQESENPEELTAAIPLVAVESTTIENADSQVYSEQQQWEDDLDIPPIDAKIERPKKPIVEKAKFDKKKSGVGKYIAIAAIAIIAVGAVPTFIYFDEIKAKLFGSKEGMTEMADADQFEFEGDSKEDQDHYVEQVEEQLSDSLLTESEKPEEVIPEPTPAPAQPETNQMESNMNAGGNYHLVVGSFQNETYAQNFEKKMRTEGNTNANVFGPVGGFYMVSLGSYSSQQEAKAALADKIGNYPKLWIFKGN